MLKEIYQFHKLQLVKKTTLLSLFMVKKERFIGHKKIQIMQDFHELEKQIKLLQEVEQFKMKIHMLQFVFHQVILRDI